jgi:hypothetical protein
MIKPPGSSRGALFSGGCVEPVSGSTITCQGLGSPNGGPFLAANPDPSLGSNIPITWALRRTLVRTNPEFERFDHVGSQN